MNLLFWVKLTATPLLILLCMIASRRWGPFVAGLLAGFPAISGPISFLLTLEQGAAFSALAAYHTLWGIESCGVFVLLYAFLAYARVPWFAALPASLGVFFLAAWGSLFITPALWLLILIAFLTPGAILILLPKFPPDAGKTVRTPGWMVPIQMACGGILVYAISRAASDLGAEWSGILAFFPVLLCVILPVVHVACGVASTVKMIRGFMSGWFGGIAFTACVALTVEHWPVAVCYTAASAGALTASGLAVYLKNALGESPEKDPRSGA